MRQRFRSKAAARQAVWDALQSERLARFPFPPHGRIPNFAGAGAAAERLLEHAPLVGVRRIKVNPDAPQLPLRVGALRRGIEVYMPTPRLRGGFVRLDPRRIPAAELRRAATLSRGARFREEVPLEELPELDLIVCGSVAVTREGRRCGKGEGYSDLEYAILRELGHPPAPVATTVHSIQIVADFPWEPNDLPVSYIATPEQIIEVAAPPPAPASIDWSRLGAKELSAMPVLAELREWSAGQGRIV